MRIYRSKIGCGSENCLHNSKPMNTENKLLSIRMVAINYFDKFQSVLYGFGHFGHFECGNCSAIANGLTFSLSLQLYRCCLSRCRRRFRCPVSRYITNKFVNDRFLRDCLSFIGIYSPLRALEYCVPLMALISFRFTYSGVDSIRIDFGWRIENCFVSLDFSCSPKYTRSHTIPFFFLSISPFFDSLSLFLPISLSWSSFSLYRSLR